MIFLLNDNVIANRVFGLHLDPQLSEMELGSTELLGSWRNRGLRKSTLHCVVLFLIAVSL